MGVGVPKLGDGVCSTGTTVGTDVEENVVDEGAGDSAMLLLSSDVGLEVDADGNGVTLGSGVTDGAGDTVGSEPIASRSPVVGLPVDTGVGAGVATFPKVSR